MEGRYAIILIPQGNSEFENFIDSFSEKEGLPACDLSHLKGKICILDPVESSDGSQRPDLIYIGAKAEVEPVYTKRELDEAIGMAFDYVEGDGIEFAEKRMYLIGVANHAYKKFGLEYWNPPEILANKGEYDGPPSHVFINVEMLDDELNRIETENDMKLNRVGIKSDLIKLKEYYKIIEDAKGGKVEVPADENIS